MKIYCGTKVYILCPAVWVTGGPTLLHQLASQLKALGIDARMVYLPPAGIKYDNPVAPDYEKYHVDLADDIDDDEKNILIVFETYPWGLSYGKKIRKIFWWLSVDNYFDSITRYVNSIDIRKVTICPLDNFYVFSDKQVIHWCQSEYARQFVRCNGVPDERIYMVEDYLSQNFQQGEPDLSRKKDIVAYNPKKGLEYTEKLMKARPDIDWQPIVNMTPEQVKELLLHAKVYIDFGNHPGKDRIPREAALAGCVIITGRQGAAANEKDIPIPGEFKLEDTDKTGILSKIDSVLEDYGAAYTAQTAYRQQIRGDFSRFIEEVSAALEVDWEIPLWSAVVNDEDNRGIYIAKAMLELNEDYRLKFIVDDNLAKQSLTGSAVRVEYGRRYLLLEGQWIEIVTAEDADFLYQEGRIKKVFVYEGKKGSLRKQLSSVKQTDLLVV